jgi:hypothetical protein
MAARVRVVCFAVVFGFVHTADAACGEPQVSPISLASHLSHRAMAPRAIVPKRVSRGQATRITGGLQALSTQDVMGNIMSELQEKMQTHPAIAGSVLQALRGGYFEDTLVPVCTVIPYFSLGRPNCWST